MQQGYSYGRLPVCHYSSCAVYRLYSGASCYCTRETGNGDWLLVNITIMLYTECTVGLTVSATGQQVLRTKCWSQQQLGSISSVICGLLWVQQSNSYISLTVGHYSICAVYRLYCGAYCECNRARGRADCLLVPIAIVLCTVCILGLTISAKCRADWLLVTVAIVRFTFCTVGLTVSATGQQGGRLTVGHYSNCAVYRLYFGAYC